MVVFNYGKAVAVKKSSGKTIWETRDYGDAYSTPAIFDQGGKSRLAVFAGEGLAVLDLKSGKELYFYEWKTKYDVNAASPIVIGDRVFISSGYDHGSAMLELGKKDVKVLWESRVMRNKMSGCVLWEDHLYGFDESILKCVDLEGNEKWRKRGIGKGAHLIVDGKLVIIGAKGELVFAEATPEEYRELARTKVLDGGVFWTTPVLVDGLIYCRSSRGELVCLDHRGERIER